MMFHPSSASIKHKLDVHAMLTSIRQTRGRPPFRASSKSGTPCGELFSFAPASIEPGSVDEAPAGQPQSRSASARSTGSSRHGGKPAADLHPFPFRSPSASPGIPDRLYTYRRSASGGPRSSSQKSSSLPPEDISDLRRRDVSRRSGGSSVQRPEHDEYERNVSKVVAVRLGNAPASRMSSEGPIAALQPRAMVMRKVPHACLRAEDHERGRKATIDDLKRPFVVPSPRFMELAATSVRRMEDPLALCDLVLPYCPKDVRRKLAILSKGARSSFSQLVGEDSPEKDSRVAQSRACQRLAVQLEAIPAAFVEALGSFIGHPPKAVLAMARVVTPVVEQDPQLCLLPDATIAWKLLQGHLTTTFSPSAGSCRGSLFLAHLASLSPPDGSGLPRALARDILKSMGSESTSVLLHDDPCAIIEAYILALCRWSIEE